MLLFSNNLIPSVTTNLNVAVLQSTVSPYVELFEIDCTNITGMGIIYYLTAESTPLVFGGRTYTPFPLEISGISSSADGAPARPTIEISNVRDVTGALTRFIGSLAFIHEDLIGAKVTYIRTFSDYLNLSSRISAPPLKYFIAKKLAHNKTTLKFELRNPIDKERAFLPKRQMLKRDFPGLGVNKRVG